MEDSEDTFFVFLMYSLAMLVLPLLTFFGSKNLLEKEFLIDGASSVAWSVISAVIVVNVIILMYALRGYRQEVAEENQNSKNIFNRAGISAKKPRYVRINTLHCTPDEVIKFFRKEGWTFLPVPSDYSDFLEIISNLKYDTFTRDFHIKELLVFPSCAQFYENELYQNGSILLQDKASCLPAFLLKPRPNSVVLDMCSAPGMKTTHLSAIMKNKGQIYAVEIDSDRYKVLCDFIRGASCTNITPLHMDALKISEKQKNKDFSWVRDVEYILVDPSCSGSGMVERMKIFRDKKNDSKRLQKLCRFQFKLLKHALTNFPKVKRVVYSTCSVLPEENEMVVEDILKMLNGKIHSNDEMKFKLADPLKTSWPRRGSDDYEHGKQCIFSDPEKDLTNGFFITVFEKVENHISVKEESEDINIPEEKSKRKKLKESQNFSLKA